MESIVNAITKTIPISMFNRGLAGKIFSDVKTNGPKVVMKNNAAEVVLISPAEYIEMMNIINDYLLLSKAVDRMIKLTSTDFAPWTVIEGNDKKYARIKALKTICDRLEERLKDE